MRRSPFALRLANTPHRSYTRSGGSCMNTQTLRKHALAWGATDMRVADLALLRGIETSPPDLLDGYDRAMCVAVCPWGRRKTTHRATS